MNQTPFGDNWYKANTTMGHFPHLQAYLHQNLMGRGRILSMLCSEIKAQKIWTFTIPGSKLAQVQVLYFGSTYGLWTTLSRPNSPDFSGSILILLVWSILLGFGKEENWSGAFHGSVNFGPWTWKNGKSCNCYLTKWFSILISRTRIYDPLTKVVFSPSNLSPLN